jgi:ribosomal protein S18 acetylase RimI-like enzyme
LEDFWKFSSEAWAARFGRFGESEGLILAKKALPKAGTGPTAHLTAILSGMPENSPEIIHCPFERFSEALALVLTDLAPSQRREIAGPLLNVEDAMLAGESLYVALRGERLCGAAWGQRQSGNIAVFWPPQLVAGENPRTAEQLASAVVRRLDETAVEMTQVLTQSRDAEVARVLTHVGFHHLADLLYLTCEAERFPPERPASCELTFLTYEASLRDRLAQLIERTYVGTLDCTALNGARHIDHVITGYQATGVFRPQNWLIVRVSNVDVGVLLLADHPQLGHWELLYMGLVPEARGYGWGRQISQHAQWLARRAAVERIVLAVDAANEPALRMYRGTGFEMWDRRTVYARFAAKLSS